MLTPACVAPRRTRPACSRCDPTETDDAVGDQRLDHLERAVAPPARASPAPRRALGDHCFDLARGRAGRASAGRGRPSAVRRDRGLRSAARAAIAAPSTGRVRPTERRAPPAARSGGQVTIVGRNAVTPYSGSRRGDLADRSRIGGEVVALAAVDLDVDEARGRPAARRRRSSRVGSIASPAGVERADASLADHDVECLLADDRASATRPPARRSSATTVVMATFLPTSRSRPARRAIGTERTDLDPGRRQRDAPAQADRGEQRRRALALGERIA